MPIAVETRLATIVHHVLRRATLWRAPRILKVIDNLTRATPDQHKSVGGGFVEIG
jgi:hypothetical protein